MRRVAPGATYETVLESGIAGLVGQVHIGLIDNVGGVTQALSTATIIETPAGSGVYTAVPTAPDTPGQYSVLWSLDGTTDPDEVTLGDEILVTTAAPDTPTGDAYATPEELARILKIRAPTDAQTAAMNRVLITAAGEIDSEIDFSDGNDLAGWQLALAAEVNLERAVEHWQQEESPFGIVGINDTGVAYTAKDSWNRHALKLAPLKEQWGLA